MRTVIEKPARAWLVVLLHALLAVAGSFAVRILLHAGETPLLLALALSTMATATTATYFVHPENRRVHLRVFVATLAVNAMTFYVLSIGWFLPAGAAMGVGIFVACATCIPTFFLYTLAEQLSELFFVRRRRFPQPTDCGTCGYDLTGNVSGRCPECGASIGKRAAGPDEADRSPS